MFAQQAPAAADEEAHERRAHDYLSQNQPKLAISEFQSVLATDPENLDARANLGVLLFFEKDYAGAIPNLRQAVAQKADLSKIRALLGLAEKYIGQASEARADLEAAVPQLDEAPIRIQAGLALMEIDTAAQDLDKAAAVASLLRQIAPTDPRVLYASYRIATDQANEALLSLSVAAPESAQMHQAMAHELERSRDIPGTIANLRSAAEIDPELAGIHYELAEALEESDDPKLRVEARSQYQLALQQNPGDALSAEALGDLAVERGDFPAATKLYQQALAIDPHQAAASIGLAKIKMQDEDFRGAAPMLEAVLAADPTNTLAHYRLSLVYRRLGRPADARREVEAYQHYKKIKDQLQATYQKMRLEGRREAETAPAPAK